MNNTNFFSINRFEKLLETNTNYLLDCLIYYGLDKNFKKNKNALELIIEDFKKNYKFFCNYPKDKGGNYVPFSVYDLPFLFKSFIDKDGNYSRLVNNEQVIFKIISDKEYERQDKKIEKNYLTEVVRKYFDDFETERSILIKNNLKTVHRENSYRNEDIVTYTSIVMNNNKKEENQILITPSKIKSLDFGIMLSGVSENYEQDRDFRNYTEKEKQAIVDAMRKLCNVDKLNLKQRKVNSHKKTLAIT